MSSTDQPLTVLCAADDEYAMPMAVMLRSLATGLRPDVELVVYVIDGGIRRRNRERITASLAAQALELRWRKPDPRFVPKKIGRGHFAVPATYSRLQASETIPPEYRKAIYLDSDLIVNGDLAELWELEPDGRPLLAVQDRVVRVVSSPWGLANYKALGHEPDTRCFNAGVLVMDLEVWRRRELGLRVVDYVRNERRNIRWEEQDALNALLARDWSELDPTWNYVVSSHGTPSYSILRRDEEDEAESPAFLRSRGIVHFATVHKPWHSNYRHAAARELFFEHLDDTAWAGWRPRRLYDLGRRLIEPVKRRLAQVLVVALLAVACGEKVETGLGSAGSPGSADPTLRGLPYLEWSEEDADSEISGAVVHDPARVQPGVNLYTGRGGAAVFVDLEGNPIHDVRGMWQLYKPGPRDELLFVGKAVGSISLDAKISWVSLIAAHHDLADDEDGKIYTLTRRRVFEPRLGAGAPIDDHYVVVLEPGGRVLREISISRLLLESPRRELLEHAYRTGRRHYSEDTHPNGIDALHANTVEVVRRDYYRGGVRLFGRDDVLISINRLSLIAVVDLREERIVWSWGPGETQGQHQPTILDSGNILLFDNGQRRGYSRVLELNPVTEQIEWEYLGEPRESFFSRSRGGAERLPNGNTLITESAKGRAFEIQPDGTVVWEYWNPRFEDGKRALIYRFSRLTDPAWIERIQSGRESRPRGRRDS